VLRSSIHRINTLALAARLPTIYYFREYVEVGGLMSYGPNIPDLFRRAADYVDKISQFQQSPAVARCAIVWGGSTEVVWQHPASIQNDSRLPQGPWGRFQCILSLL
jgi:hypothetical protein